MKTILTSLILVPAVCVIAGCASGEIHSQNNPNAISTGTLERPSHIYVSPVDATQATIKADQSDIAAIQAKVGSDLQKDLVDDLANIAPTSIGCGSTGWLVTVTPTHIDPGSATMRFVVGFGSGQSKVNAKFSVFRLQNGGSTPIFENIDVDADTGIQTGAETFTEGNGRDVSRIAREIKGFLLDHVSK